MKRFFALLSILIVLIVGCKDNSIESSTEDLSQATIQVTVDETTSQTKTVYFEDGDPLLEVMREYFEIETEESEFGTHIVAIDGYDTRELEGGGHWEYAINNIQSTTSEDLETLQDGDTVEWNLWEIAAYN